MTTKRERIDDLLERVFGQYEVTAESRELREEIASNLSDATADLMASGTDEAAAVAQAYADFGSIEDLLAELGVRKLTRPDDAADVVITAIPELPDVPEIPSIPDIPEIPVIPDIPDAPAAPQAPKAPDVDIEAIRQAAHAAAVRASQAAKLAQGPEIAAIKQAAKDAAARAKEQAQAGAREARRDADRIKAQAKAAAREAKNTTWHDGNAPARTNTIRVPLGDIATVALHYTDDPIIVRPTDGYELVIT